MHSENDIFGSQNMLAALENVHDAVVLLDSTETVFFFNRAAEQLWGYPRISVLGCKASTIPLFGAIDVLSCEAENEQALTVITATGEETSLAATISYDGPEIQAHLVVLWCTLTPRERVTKLSTFDRLTGLPNRSALHQYIDQMMTSGEHARAAFFFLDLDHFKDVNDALGYAAGDNVLVAIAQRLRTEFSRRGFVSHADSDAFVLVIPDCDSTRATSIAQKIRGAVPHAV